MRSKLEMLCRGLLSSGGRHRTTITIGSTAALQCCSVDERNTEVPADPPADPRPVIDQKH